MSDSKKDYPKNKLIGLLEIDLPGLFDAIQKVINRDENFEFVQSNSKQNLKEVSSKIRAMTAIQFEKLLKDLPKNLSEIVHR